jgi:hypothetical protein
MLELPKVPSVAHTSKPRLFRRLRLLHHRNRNLRLAFRCEEEQTSFEILLDSFLSARSSGNSCASYTRPFHLSRDLHHPYHHHR